MTFFDNFTSGGPDTSKWDNSSAGGASCTHATTDAGSGNYWLNTTLDDGGADGRCSLETANSFAPSSFNQSLVAEARIRATFEGLSADGPYGLGNAPFFNSGRTQYWFFRHNAPNDQYFWANSTTSGSADCTSSWNSTNVFTYIFNLSRNGGNAETWPGSTKACSRVFVQDAAQEFVFEGTVRNGINAFRIEADYLKIYKSADPMPTAIFISTESGNEKPVSTLDSPDDGHISAGDVAFTCSATDDVGLSSIRLYHNITGTFALNQTSSVGGTSNSTTFNVNSLPQGTVFVWNCEAKDIKNQTAFAPANRTITIKTLRFEVQNSTSTIFSVDQFGNANVSGDLSLKKVLFDTGDYVTYDTTNNKYKFYIGNSVVFCINSSGGFNGNC